MTAGFGRADDLKNNLQQWPAFFFVSRVHRVRTSISISRHRGIRFFSFLEDKIINLMFQHFVDGRHHSL
jgi:hypothetical protein